MEYKPGLYSRKICEKEPGDKTVYGKVDGFLGDHQGWCFGIKSAFALTCSPRGSLCEETPNVGLEMIRLWGRSQPISLNKFREVPMEGQNDDPVEKLSLSKRAFFGVDYVNPELAFERGF